jgi:hypothetical protein
MGKLFCLYLIEEKNEDTPYGEVSLLVVNGEVSLLVVM